MNETEKQRLLKELEAVKEKIQAVKLADVLDVKQYKVLIRDREAIEFRLGIGE